MYYLYPTVSTDSACTRVSAMTYALICPYPDWLYRLRAVAVSPVSRHLILERKSSLIFRKSNPITLFPRPALLVSLSFSDVLHRDNRVSFFRGNFRSPRTSTVGNGINSPVGFFCAGRVSLVARQLHLFIRRIGHASRASLKIAPRTKGTIRHGSRDSIGTARLTLSSAYV